MSDVVDDQAEGQTLEREDGMSRAVEVAYKHIRRDIITGELRSGDTLQEAKLAAKIGVSRTPIREALNRLNGEGLVVLQRYKRGYVSHFSSQDVAEVFRLRAILEGHAAGRAATRISDEDIARLDVLEERMEELFGRLGWNEHLEGFDDLNAEFHAVIAHAADSPRLERILASSLELPASIFNSYAEPVDERTRRTHVQHREIITALKTRNAQWAEAAMRGHLSSLLVTTEEG